MTGDTGGLIQRTKRAGSAVFAALFSDGPACPERITHHLVAFEIERGDTIDEAVCIRSGGSVYQISRYVADGKRTLTLRTDRGQRVVNSDRIVGMTILESWEGTPDERVFEDYSDVFARYGWTDRTAYPGASGG